MVCSGWLKNGSKKIVYNPESNKCIMHQCESCPDTATLKEFLDQELNEHEDDEKCILYTSLDQMVPPT